MLWDLWEVTGFRWGHGGGAPKIRLVPLYMEEQIRVLSLSLPYEYIRRVLPAIWKGVLIWYQIYKNLDFGFPAFRTVRTMGIRCSRPPFCGILLQQSKLTTLNSFLPLIPAACLAPPPNRSTNIATYFFFKFCLILGNFNIFLKLVFNWRIIVLQCHIGSYCKTIWIIINIYITPPSWASFPCHPNPLGHHRAPDCVPYVIPQLPTSYLFHIQ